MIYLLHIVHTAQWMTHYFAPCTCIWPCSTWRNKTIWRLCGFDNITVVTNERIIISGPLSFPEQVLLPNLICGQDGGLSDVQFHKSVMSQISPPTLFEKKVSMHASIVFDESGSALLNYHGTSYLVPTETQPTCTCTALWTSVIWNLTTLECYPSHESSFCKFPTKHTEPIQDVHKCIFWLTQPMLDHMAKKKHFWLTQPMVHHMTKTTHFWLTQPMVHHMAKKKHVLTHPGHVAMCS